MVTGKGTVLQKAKVMRRLVQEKNPSGTAAAFPSQQWSRLAVVGQGWGQVLHLSLGSTCDRAPLRAGQPGFLLVFSPELALAVI